MYQKKYTDSKCRDIEYAVGNKVLLLTNSPRLHGTRKFRDHFMGQHIGAMVHHLDLLHCAAFRVF